MTIGSKNLTWEGRQLKSITDGTNSLSFTYYGDGKRLFKTVNGTITQYFYNGDILSAQKKGTDVIYFRYDNSGDIFGFTLNGADYTYVKNAQNDVVAITDASGNVIADYAYDDWGKVTEISGNTAVAEANPIRYRSYYYDVETQWYYLNTRYYDPGMGRFISSDDSDIIDGGNDHILENNLFTYCFNSPVNMTDAEGYYPQSAINIAKVGVGVLAISVGVAVTAATGGAAMPVLVASLKIAAVSAISSGVISAGVNRISTGSWKDSGQAFVNGAADGFMWGGISAGATFTTVAAKGVKIKEIGRLKPANKSGKGYKGVKYQAKKSNGKYTTKSIELHSPHKKGPHNKWHWQQNTWSEFKGISRITGSSKHWTLFWRRF